MPSLTTASPGYHAFFFLISAAKFTDSMATTYCVCILSISSLLEVLLSGSHKHRFINTSLFGRLLMVSFHA